ncbi:unnamed protein product [Ceratitis capitata]|uniref:(Mediterranean fruit fly) hypothetical protein n=1 Tax=Ceratitis capitata TaxID=7213 RepID=A0A811UBB8_CERCA|nr:unnamed protein product [Ceratitis capitata]
MSRSWNWGHQKENNSPTRVNIDIITNKYIISFFAAYVHRDENVIHKYFRSKKIGCPVKIKLERKLDKEKQIEVLHVTKLTVKHNHEPNDLSEDELSDMEENQHNSNNMTDSKLLALRKALQKIETFARQKNDDELERIENIVTKLHEHLTNDLDVTFLQKVNVSLEAGNYSVHFEQPIDQENSISIIEDFSEIQTVKTPCQKRGRGRPRGSKKAQL